MRTTELIQITTIQYDKLPINKSVLDLVFFILSGGVIPPVKLEAGKDGWILKDGRHRVAAYKLLGYTQINAKFYKAKEPYSSAA